MITDIIYGMIYLGEIVAVFTVIISIYSIFKGNK